ncbi:MAG: 4-alpha-glucanotransferase [Planctomycetia bacterium]|nr:4-alpha-glucanotransferase [Planctomycetia bacterium]
MKTDRYKIADAYEDAFGVRRETTPATRAAVRAAMRVEGDGPLRPPPVYVLDRRKGTLPHVGRGDLRLEDGTSLAVDDGLPADLPLGYHDFLPADGKEPIRLIVSPGQCYPPPELLAWGWSAQLYAARSQASWGMGDLADLRSLARWSRGQGAGFVLVNPLPAVDPVPAQESSPYYPSSRRFRNPLYLRVEDVPGATAMGEELAELAAEGRRLNGDRRIRRDEVFRLKQAALARLWERFGGDPAFDRFRREQGRALVEFATFCTLVDKFGPDWGRWEAEYRRPNAPGVPRFATENARRIEYHQWLQWLVDRQLEAAGNELPIVEDMPIGVTARGADAWAWQDVLADGMSVGAPPDIYNTQGQNWGFPPWIPHRLQAAKYEPFVQTIRAMLSHAGGLRIDHVLGLFRLFWIPYGMSPVEGTYVRYPAEDLLAIIALESDRARAFVVGEDLGTVGNNVRRMLAAARMLSYRLLWFESQPTSRYPKLAMAAVTTHDLPTVAGLWNGSDLAAQESLGLKPNAEAIGAIRDRVRKMTRLAETASEAEAVRATYELLGRAPSAVVTATLDDALEVSERPNMPATTFEWPNWCLSLPAPLETLMASPLAGAIAESLSGRAGRAEGATKAGEKAPGANAGRRTPV